jgi:hypothetical protein
MIQWIEFGVYATFVSMVWFGFPASSSRFAVTYVADRNADWLRSHPGLAEKLNSRRWSLWSCYGLGFLSLAVLFAFHIGLWPQSDALSEPGGSGAVMQSIAAASAFIAIAYFAVGAALFHRWLQKEVPLARRRHASLERRSIDNFVPRWLRLATYALVGVHWTAWVLVGVLGPRTGDFWPRVVVQVVFPLACLALMHAAVVRRPNALDRIFGLENRRWEVRFAFAIQFYLLAWGALSLYETVAEATAFDIQRATRLVPALIVITGFGTFILNSRRRTGGTGPTPAYTKRTEGTAR